MNPPSGIAEPCAIVDCGTACRVPSKMDDGSVTRADGAAAARSEREAT